MTLEYMDLVRAAQAAHARAYAPYSRFQVGAAALSASGRVFPGCNIENAAYPATVCAERVALFSAYAAGEHAITTLAIVTDTPDPASPCGTCRQVIRELAPDCTVVLANMRGDVYITTPDALLPGAFTSQELRAGRNE
jgi:cytidine deaminase